MLAKQLVPKDQRGEIVWGNVNARLVTQQNFPLAGNFDRYIIQLPVSKEIQQADPRNNTRAESRMNLLFYMNPSEIERLLNDGLGHQLEYYCDYFQTKLSDRYAVHFEHLQNEADNKYANELLQEAAKRREALSPQAARSQAEGKGSIGIFPRMKAMMKVMVEGFTGIESFTGDLSVRNGKPDSIYLYMCWKFYVLQIQDLTNQLTIINTKIENIGGIAAARDGRRGGLALAQENLYKKLINIIFEMDVWNYFIQTPPAPEQGRTQESPEDIG